MRVVLTKAPSGVSALTVTILYSNQCGRVRKADEIRRRSTAKCDVLRRSPRSGFLIDCKTHSE